MILLTEAEVAERLRCKPAKVKRLRLTGKLAYIPGKPVVIDKADVEDYLQRIRKQVEEKLKPKESQFRRLSPQMRARFAYARYRKKNPLKFGV